jgi:transcriptional regulator with XRE-family HTH domain
MNNICKEITRKLHEEYNNGTTQSELAKKYNISTNHLCNLLSGKRNVADMKVETLCKMFPNISLGHNNLTNVSGNTQINSNNNFFTSDIDNFRRKLLEAVIDLDIDDVSRTKVLKLIKSLQE